MRRILCLLAITLTPTAIHAQTPARPNIVFILIDDLRFDDIACMGHPFVKTPNIDRLAREGALFKNAYATTPLCSPSRASILTGRYAHSHGVKDNTNNDERSHKLVTFMALLKQAGYATAFIGKWHMGTDDSPRPGIDYWVGVKGQGQYVDPELNVDGQRKQFKGYATDVYNRLAVDFIRRPRDRPFVLYLSHKAVHPNLVQNADGSISDPSASQFMPATRHKHLFADAKIPRRPNALFEKLEGKPALTRKIGDLPLLSKATGTSDEVVRDRLRMLVAVEEGVGDILKALEEKKILDQTLIVFTSDHGYFYGEHGLSVERRLAYEETARVPLLMRYPPLIKAGATIEQFALLIDMAPTFLELAGKKPPANMHGRSLVPLLKGEQPARRESFLIEYFSDKVFPRMDRMGYRAVKTSRWKFIQYSDLAGMDELYDLRDDPYEMHNRIGDAVLAKVVEELRREIDRLVKATP